ncbi:TonB-dependent receptor [Elysia marginata]|uniref:TonB-dependent receptor n=1 Tax=Elysia marginata TaxID=1093978 RepID=A0AAV4FXT2_9GAST|nr:TonB-dependent receptor [Elysia marginata]
MNSLYNGIPKWHLWSGLNDITKNQDYSFGLGPSSSGVEGLLGISRIHIDPSENNRQGRVSVSLANRSYIWRTMGTYHSGLGKRNLAFSVSASKRFGTRGYIEGTNYNATSVYGGITYKPNNMHQFGLLTCFSESLRGQRAAITKEVFELKGRTYNPYWGFQNGSVRNSRETSRKATITMLNYRFHTDRLEISLGASYIYNLQKRSRLDYFNTNNPDAVYYRNLPSYYANLSRDRLSPDVVRVKSSFLEQSQINWTALYEVNTKKTRKGKCSYLLNNDVILDKEWLFSLKTLYEFTSFLSLHTGVWVQHLKSDNYALIADLLGSTYHIDVNPFSNTKNDVKGSEKKQKGDTHKYAYNIMGIKSESFFQLAFNFKRIDAFFSANYSKTAYQRNGFFINESFADNSFGKSPILSFDNLGVKVGGSYKISGNHLLKGFLIYQTSPPTIQNSFVNPRANNTVVEGLSSFTKKGSEANYFFNSFFLKGRLTGYLFDYSSETRIAFFYAETGVGNDFFQQVSTGLGRRHWGGEFSLEYFPFPNISLDFVSSFGHFVYTQDPDIQINFDASQATEDVINPVGKVSLGGAKLRNYKLANGPQHAYALGIKYQNLKYWWVALSGNFLAENYIQIANIRRTESFFINPKDPDGFPFPEVEDGKARDFLRQEKLDEIFLFNLVMGKSWKLGHAYLNLLVSVNNLLDLTYRSGGFEQARLANYRQYANDVSQGMPSFAPKYWYASGRTFFINLSYTFRK